MPTTLPPLLFSLIILITTSTAFACDLEERNKGPHLSERDTRNFRPESRREQVLLPERSALQAMSDNPLERSELSSLPSSVASASSENFFSTIRLRLQEAFRTGDPNNPLWNEISREIKTTTKEIYAQLETCSAWTNKDVALTESEFTLHQEHIRAEQIAIDSIVLLATLPALQQSAAAVAAITKFYATTPEIPSSDTLVERQERNLQSYNTIVEKLRIALQGWKVAQESVKSRKKGLSHLQQVTTETAWQNGLQELEENVTSYQRSLAVWESDRNLSAALHHYRKTENSNLLRRAFNNRITLMMESVTSSLDSLPPASQQNRDLYLANIEHANMIYDFEMATSRTPFLYRKVTESFKDSTWNELIEAKQITLAALEKIETFLQKRLPGESLETRDPVEETPHTANRHTPEQRQTTPLLEQIALIKAQHSNELTAWTEKSFKEYQPEQTTRASFELIMTLQRSRDAHLDLVSIEEEK